VAVHAETLNLHEAGVIVALDEIARLLELRLKLRLKSIVIRLVDHDDIWDNEN
jgi:hypothetical protein